MDDVRFFIKQAGDHLYTSLNYLNKYDREMAGIHLEETVLRCQDALRYLEKGEGNEVGRETDNPG